MAERGWMAATTRAAGGSRNFKLWVPETVDKARASPLIMLLHGCTHDAEDMAEISGMNEVAEANRFLVVYPEQTRLANLLKCWNLFHPKHRRVMLANPRFSRRLSSRFVQLTMSIRIGSTWRASRPVARWLPFWQRRIQMFSQPWLCSLEQNSRPPQISPRDSPQ